jgi:hypothetical protein
MQSNRCRARLSACGWWVQFEVFLRYHVSEPKVDGGPIRETHLAGIIDNEHYVHNHGFRFLRSKSKQYLRRIFGFTVR